MTQEEIMQKPSVGFDYVGRFAGDSGDFGAAALQVRLAWNEDTVGDQEPWEVQVYNAYVKAKVRWTDLWIGHNRPALGLSSYFDSHGLLLTTLAMRGFGFDRDWGVGAYRDFSWGNAAASVTAGTGAPLYVEGDYLFRGNYLGAARASAGVLAQENWNLGLSAAAGKTLETMGYTVLDRDPKRLALLSLDLTVLRNRLEHRLEAMGGELLDERAWALLYRLGIVLDGESRWKVEGQPSYLRTGDEDSVQAAVCLSHQATPDLTIRTEYAYESLEPDHRVLLQLYYYHRL
jgi:hypothetical protein